MPQFVCIYTIKTARTNQLFLSFFHPLHSAVLGGKIGMHNFFREDMPYDA